LRENEVDNEALQVLRNRRSVRSFKPDVVPREALERMVDAGRLAPTARNVQPWEFVVVTDEAERKRLADIAEYGRFIAEAPACIVVLCKDTKYYLEDGSAATTNILNAAAAMGIGSCWVAGDKKPYADEVVRMLNGPATSKLVSLIAVGYSDENPSPPKRGLEDVLHWERY
jgi:nitroreductase